MTVDDVNRRIQEMFDQPNQDKDENLPLPYSSANPPASVSSSLHFLSRFQDKQGILQLSSTQIDEMYPIDAEADAVIDDDVEVLIVPAPQSNEERTTDANPVLVRQDESAPPTEAEVPQAEAEHHPPITEIPSDNSELQVRSYLYHVISFMSANDYVDSSPNHIDDD